MYVNKRFYKMSKDNKIWEKLFLNDFSPDMNFWYQSRYYLSYKLAHEKRLYYKKEFDKMYSYLMVK
jgi:hypothetical protein